MTAGFVREARASDAAGLARVQVTSWRASLAGLLPDAVLAELTSAEAELAARRALLTASPEGFRPVSRERPVSPALQMYAALATSASTGAARDISVLAKIAPDNR